MTGAYQGESADVVTGTGQGKPLGEAAGNLGGTGDPFAGPGETRARGRALDWTATPLGAPARWPAALRTAVRFCLDSGFPTCVFVGRELVVVHNDGFAAVLESTRRAPALGRPAREVWADRWASIGSDLRAVLDGGAAIVHEDRAHVVERNGRPEETFWTYAFSPLRDEDGTLLGVQCVVSESTGRVRAEAALRESEERYRMLTDLSPDAVWVYLDGRYVYANPAAARLMRAASPEDLLGLAPVDVVLPEHIPLVRARIADVLARGITQPLQEMRFQRRDGSLMEVEAAAGPVTWQGRPAVQVIFRDVTDRVHAAAERERLLVEADAARAEAERAAQVTSRITTYLADGICLMDAGGRLTYMNPAAERILGWTEAELRGDLLHERVHYKRPDGRPFPMSECPLGQVLAEGRPVLGLADQWIRKGGEFVHVVTTCSPILADGRVVGAVLSIHDDTERRQAEAERERLLAETRSANHAKSEFLAMMSHELRTPLNAIGGYAELIELGLRGPVTEQQRADLARIQQSQRHLLGLINQVLNYTRIEAGAVRYELTDVLTSEALAAAEALVQPQVRARGLALAADGCAPGLAVRADREKLQQILLNLLSNAIKFTEPGGDVRVRCGTRGEQVTIAVADTGIGIAPDKLTSIFEPFVQIDQRLTRPHEGVGLGLAISRDLARGMGGDLTATSAPGAGSTFTLTLPRA